MSMKLKDLHIGVRLALAFGLLLAMLAGAIGVARFEFARVGAINQRIIEKDWVKSDLVNRIDVTARDNARLTTEKLIAASAADLARIQQRIDQNKATITAALDRLDTLIYRPEGQALMAQIRQAREAFVASFSQVGRLVAQDQRVEAIALMNAQTLPAIDVLNARIAELAELQRQIVTASSAEAQQRIDAAMRLMLVLGAVGLVFGVAAAVWITRSITQPVGRALQLAQQVAAGDLTARVEVSSRDELGQLLGQLQAMTGSLGHIVGEVRSGTETISVATGQISAGNLDLSQRTEEQASSLQEIASSMEQLTATVKLNLDSVQHASQIAADATDVAVRGGAVVGEVVQTMEQINGSSRRIVEIISVIEGIAFQTNILALNAAVEAARAGEEGRGFAVVASEVRSLAGRSATAATEIKRLIETSVGNVAQGCKQVAQAGSTMDEIVVNVRRVASIMGELALSSKEQSMGLAQINQAMGQMDQVTQGNAALVEEAAAAVESLDHQAKSLVDAVGLFKLPGTLALAAF